MNISPALLSLFLLTPACVSAQKAALPALDVLKFSAAGFSLPERADIPSPLAAGQGDRTPEGLQGETLFDYLHDATAPSSAKSIISYKQAKSFMYSTADNTGCNGKPGIITLYSKVCINGTGGDGNSYRERGDQDGDGVSGDFVNAEHIWPQSYFNSALPMVADLHQLGSTLSVPNGRRGNLRFAEVSAPVYSTSAGSKLGREGFEPDDGDKGDVARAMLYFVVRYYDRDISRGMDYGSFWTSNVQMLLKWNRLDPPDAAERRRNDLIAGFQGNRNPFVDDPSLADRIGAQVFQSH